MVIRKRRQPTPNFKLPPPYEPITGSRAELKIHGIFPYVAMMQVAAEDTHENYVICRGHDTRYYKFFDYEEGNSDAPGIPVAKPFGRRKVGEYKVAQILPAALPLQTQNPSPVDVPWRVGQNPGKASGGDGHPKDLDEEVEFLRTDDGTQLIEWMLLDSDSSFRVVQGKLNSALCGEEDEEDPVVEIIDTVYVDTWEEADLSGAKILNRCRHQGGSGAIVKLHRTKYYLDGTETDMGDAWDIFDVQKYPTCLVNQVQSREFCMIQLIVKVAAERCGDLDSTCTIIEYIKDCVEEGECDATTTSSEFSLADCCFDYIVDPGT